MLDFRILTFLTVCETMHFTRAAELLHITQPAVSHQIHALEEQYGACLLYTSMPGVFIVFHDLSMAANKAQSFTHFQNYQRNQRQPQRLQIEDARKLNQSKGCGHRRDKHHKGHQKQGKKGRSTQILVGKKSNFKQ